MNIDEFTEWINRIKAANEISVDTEGYSENANQWLMHSTTLGTSVSTKHHDIYFPYNHLGGGNTPPEYRPHIKEVIENAPCIIFHNAKHDLVALDNLDIHYTGPFYDTMLMAHFVDENIPNKSLEYLSLMYGGEPKKRPDSMQAIIDGFGWQYIPVKQIYDYACQDTRITYDLKQALYPDFLAQGFEDKNLWSTEQEFVRIIYPMEVNGIRIDTELSERELERGEKKMAEIRTELGYNPGSRDDMYELFVEKMGLPVVKRTKKTGRPSMDKFAMEKYDELLVESQDPRARLVREYRGWSKTTGSNYRPYLELLSPDGRIRPNYNLHRAVTGRLSCNSPNLQQIPRTSENDWNGKLKAAFIPDEEFELVEFDYKNLEFRLAAAYGKESGLISIFDDPQQDVFASMVEPFGLERYWCKQLIYTVLYGGGIERIMMVFGKSYEEAAAIWRQLNTTYAGITKVKRAAGEAAAERGYVTYWSGRRRHLHDRHKAFNSVIQGGAAEIVKRSMLRTAQFRSELARMLLQVHDSVVWEIHKSIVKTLVPIIKAEMERVPEDFGVRFMVDAHTWGEAA
jgi:DNA polymerase-1